jgi:hypothetical protein
MARTSRPRLGRHLSNDILHLRMRLGELRGKVVPRVEEHPHGLLAGIPNRHRLRQSGPGTGSPHAVANCRARSSEIWCCAFGTDQAFSH